MISVFVVLVKEAIVEITKGSLILVG